MSCGQSNSAVPEYRSPSASYEFDMSNTDDSSVFKKIHELSRQRDSIGSHGKGFGFKSHEISIKPNKSAEPKLPPRYATTTPDGAESDFADDFQGNNKSTVKGIAMSLKYDNNGDVKTDPIFRSDSNNTEISNTGRLGSSPKDTIIPVNLGKDISSEINNHDGSHDQYVFTMKL